MAADEGKGRPTLWQMIQQAVEVLGSPTTNVAVRDWILSQWPDANRNSINAQITTCTVNHPSRIHWPENQKLRPASDPRYDTLYRTGPGQIESYDPKIHGPWEIAENETGRFVAQPAGESGPQPHTPTGNVGDFAAEAHLRDFLVKDLSVIEPGLSLFVDDDGNNGVEYTTKIGRLDILAEAPGGELVVIELKIGRSPDTVVGQILRYMNWVRRHLAGDREVRGIILAQRNTDPVRYATADRTDIALQEYEISIKVSEASTLD